MKISLLYFFFILFSQSFSYCQNLDSLNDLSKQHVCRNIPLSDSISSEVIRIAEQTGNMKALGYAWKNKATNEICRGDLKNSILHFTIAIDYLDRAKELTGVASTINNLAIAYYRFGYLDSALTLRKRQISIAIELKDTLVLAAAYQGIGSIFLDQTANDSSILYSINGLEIARKAKLEKVIGQFLVNIGAAHYQSNNFVEALSYYREALPLLEKINDSYNLGNLYNNMGGIYKKIDLDSAMYFMEKGIAIHKNIGNLPMLAYGYQGLADVYFSKELYQDAVDYNLKAKEINDQTGQLSNQATVLHNLASCYTKLGQPDRAIPILKKSIEIASTEGYLKNEANANLFLSEAYDAVGDYRLAYRTHLRYTELHDRFINEQKNAVVSELQTKYETEKKDGEIATLSQKAQIQALQISQRNTQLIGAGIALLVLILGGFAFNQQRKFKHQQAVSDMEQRMLRLQMNPHFIFNALASIQNYILQSDTKESVSYLAKFGKLMRQILEHSREEFITIEEETDMLRNYLEIQQLRFKNRFDFKIEVDAAIDPTEMQIPPLFAQPFVENAIEHGLKDKTSDGLITIRFSPEGKNIRLEVEDNGSGIAAGINTQKEHKSLATVITRERLSIFENKLKRKFDLIIQNQGTGTLAILSLPMN
ncbi:MAG: tetratricopeptide (TPR) repeat protein [Cyclobacteriaceae bacterium]|jgi:tetratricopeptide (TPR) repeat protein